MSDDLTDDQIALLCDIGEHDLFTLIGDARRDMALLMSAGYVEAIHNHPASPLQLTAKATTFLGMRGAGLNEA